jgi:hypothetical protein
MTTPLHISITQSTVKWAILGNSPGSKQLFLIMGGFMGEAFMCSFLFTIRWAIYPYKRLQVYRLLPENLIMKT